MVPSDGRVLVSFTEPFLQLPSCSFDGATLPGERLIITVNSVSLKAKPNETMHYTCTGLKKPEEKPWKFIGIPDHKEVL